MKPLKKAADVIRPELMLNYHPCKAVTATVSQVNNSQG